MKIERRKIEKKNSFSVPQELGRNYGEDWGYCS